MSALKTTVTGLAATPNVDQAAEQPSCTLSFGLGGLSRGHVDVIRPDGSVACSSRPREGKAPLAGICRGGLAEARARRTGVARPGRRRRHRRSLVVSAAPTPGHGVVAAFFALAPVGRALVDTYGGGRPVEFLITTAGGRTILTRSIDPDRWVGATSPARRSHRGSGRDVDGTGGSTSTPTCPAVGWTFYAGEDEARRSRPVTVCANASS